MKYLVPSVWLKNRLIAAKDSLYYCRSHNTGSAEYKGGLKTTIEILEKIKTFEKMIDEN